MIKDQLESRIQELQKNIEQSKANIDQHFANHNAILGRLAEAKELLKLLLEESEKVIDEVKEGVVV